jgi:lipoic acid synthetase
MKQRRHPDWLKIKLPQDEKYYAVQNLIHKNKLNTVCSKAKCPNQSECYSCGSATFLIMGETCTRNCLYCNIENGKPVPLDVNEPDSVAKAIKILGLDYVVITSVTRDDLSDYGANHFYQTILEVKKQNPAIKIEILTPDFKMNMPSIEKVLSAHPDVFNHNIEVAESLFSVVRPQGSYSDSLALLRVIKQLNPSMVTKSGLMLGLGETESQIKRTILDLFSAGVEILTLGQYLQPKKTLYPVQKYYHPDEFREYKAYAESLGFKHVFAAPLVRSSYHAKELGSSSLLS